MTKKYLMFLIMVMCFISFTRMSFADCFNPIPSTAMGLEKCHMEWTDSFNGDMQKNPGPTIEALMSFPALLVQQGNMVFASYCSLYVSLVCNDSVEALNKKGKEEGAQQMSIASITHRGMVQQYINLFEQMGGNVKRLKDVLEKAEHYYNNTKTRPFQK